MALFSREFASVLIMALGFMFIFSAYQPGKMIAANFIESISNDYYEYNGRPYVTLGILYLCFSLTSWIVPSIMARIGAPITLWVGSVHYILCLVCIYFPIDWLLYIGAATLGIGAALLWGAQAALLTTYSTPDNLSRNISIFYSVHQTSLLIGNLFIFFYMSGEPYYCPEIRQLIIYTFLGFVIVGVLVLMAIPYRPSKEDLAVLDPLYDFTDFFLSTEFALLTVIFIYSGIHVTFYSGVYGNAVGFTENLGSNFKQDSSLVGIFIGAGQIIGNYIFGIVLAKRFQRKTPLITAGCLINLLAYVLIYLNLPDSAVVTDTMEDAIIESSIGLCCFCGFLMGIGDSSITLHIYTHIMTYYYTQAPAAFALFKFVQSLAQGVAFVYVPFTGLHTQILILAIVGVLGTLLFSISDYDLSFSLSI